ncbi:hypothetical protein KJ359_004954 [Pestalotiopsis sp. 9143b]|nr:hypothetical protein KJ359_004954 [Pestalotiopsis sp. 9143b]
MAMDMAMVTTSPPSPTQEGIAPNCVRWMKAYDVDRNDTCAGFASRAQDHADYFYSLNPFLGKNGENCSQMFWANYWYCITGGTASSASTVVSITPTPTVASAAQSSAVSSKTNSASTQTTLQISVQSAASPTGSSSSSKAIDTVKTSTAASTPTPSSTQSVYEPKGAKYIGCASELSTGRALPGCSFQYSKMSVDVCLKYCSDKNYPFSGLENGRECWCGNSVPEASKVDSGGAGRCTTKCLGNMQQMCGGQSLLSVYQNSTVQPAVIPPTVNGFQYVGCYDESRGRVLPDFRTSDDRAMTVESCVKTCDDRGMPWAGVEYGQECWCAKTPKTDAPVLKAESCGMQCSGNAKQNCGGPSALSMYFKRNGGLKDKARRDGGGGKKRDMGPHATTAGADGRPTVVKTVRMVRRGRFGRRDAFPA